MLGGCVKLSTAPLLQASSFRRSVPAWFKRSLKTITNHLDFDFGDSVLKSFKNASSVCGLQRSFWVPLDSNNQNSISTSPL